MAGISISIDTETLNELEKVSKEYKLPKSFIIRKALEEYFNKLERSK